MRMFIDATAFAQLDDVVEYAPDFWEAEAELAAQYHSEVSAYGDAWPGAAIELQNAREESDWVSFVIDLWNALRPPFIKTPRDFPLTDDVF